jgi:hypothetical protein
MRSRAVLDLAPDGEGWKIQAIELLGSGQTLAARDLVAGHLNDDVFAVCVTVDGAVRRHEAGLSDIAQAARAVAAAGATDLRLDWWLRAMVADRLLLDGDFDGMAAVAPVLAEMPTALLADTLTLWIRGRLRRSLGLALLVSPAAVDRLRPWLSDDHRDHWAAATDDLRRAGFGPEVAVTRALFTGLAALLRWEDPCGNLRHVIEARAEVAGADADWMAWIDFLAGLIALMVGDAERAREISAHLQAVLPPSSRYTPIGPYFAAMASLVEDGTADTAPADRVEEPLAVIEDAIEGVRGLSPRLVPVLQLHTAHVLGDRGHPAAARFGVVALDAPSSTPVDDIGHDLLAVRVDAARGRLAPAPAVLDLLQRLVDHGYGQEAAGKALRVAQDYRRLGAAADAEVLRAWGLARLDTDHERAQWDARWSAPEPPAGWTRPPASAGLSLHVLVPVLELYRDGAAVPVRPAVARLILVLVLAHPGPVHVEQAADKLWPDLTLDVARGRLNTTVHRLRRLFPDDEPVVCRRGDVIELTPDTVDVDLFRYRAAVRGGPDDQAAAVLGVRGSLCHVQFPYDEGLLQARNELAAEWLALARSLLDRGAIEPGDLAPVLDRLDGHDALGLRQLICG